MKYITLEQVLIFHDKIIDRTGGKKGIKDIGLIDSAINRAFVTFDGKELYPENILKISVATHSLISNHGFIDGNKRIGVGVMLLLLKINDIEIYYSQNELIDFGLGVATGRMNHENIQQWVIEHRKGM